MSILGSAPHLSVYEIEQGGHQNVGKGHEVHYPIIDALCGLPIGLALHHRTAHGTLGIRKGRKCQQKQQ